MQSEVLHPSMLQGCAAQRESDCSDARCNREPVGAC
jgi:hypothetical protein